MNMIFNIKPIVSLYIYLFQDLNMSRSFFKLKEQVAIKLIKFIVLVLNKLKNCYVFLYLSFNFFTNY